MRKFLAWFIILTFCIVFSILTWPLCILVLGVAAVIALLLWALDNV